MEYALGSVITLAAIVIMRLLLRRQYREPPPAVRYSQSHVYDLISPFLPTNSEMKIPAASQMSRHLDEVLIKIVFTEGKAYWIKDDKFYVADVKDYEIQHETATQVDTMSMDKVELDKIILVVEELTKGKTNDSRNAW